MNRTVIDALQLPYVMRASVKSILTIVVPVCLFLLIFCVSVLPTVLGNTTHDHHIVSVFALALPILLPQFMLLSWWFTVRVTIDCEHIICKNCFSSERLFSFDDIAKVQVSSGRGTKYLKLIPKNEHESKFTIPLHVLSDYNRKILGDLFKDNIDNLL